MVCRVILAGIIAATVAQQAWADSVNVSSLDIQNAQIGKPIANKSADGNPIMLNGQKFENGVSIQAPGRIVIDLHKTATRFTAIIGVDDEVKGKGSGGTVAFRIFGDGRTLFAQPRSPLAVDAVALPAPQLPPRRLVPPPAPVARGPVTSGAEPVKVDIDVTGVRDLVLEVDATADGPANDHAVWADAKIEYSASKPDIPALILTPKVAPSPRLTGARIFGVRPDHPFMFTVPATGNRPMQFSAEGLPDGLKLDSATGFISGRTSKRGEYNVKLQAKNAQGAADGTLKIVVGDLIALTPPLGWNSWNCFGASVTGENIKQAADAMVSSGLINHGWTYINIDDYWEFNQRLATQGDPTMQGVTARQPDGTISTNKRFPDMRGLVDHIHGLGLKAGIYSGPGPTTCGGCTASWEHEEQDARTIAGWGFDYLKYDWCSYDEVIGGRPQMTNLDALQKPYKVMQEALKKQDRDIIYSLCQYGWGDVWKWGDQVGGQLWRTTGDITDTWQSLTSIWNRQVPLFPYAKPGNWNDADMMIIGWVSVGSGRNFHPSYLTPNEQYSHVSLWCLLAAPMLIGCDMTRWDDFSLSLLTNDEMLEINQDPLGKQASRIVNENNLEIWAKDMSDGSKAVGFFNRTLDDAKIAIPWNTLNIKGPQVVRDVWRQKDVGTFDNQYETAIPHHGAVVVRIRPAGR